MIVLNHGKEMIACFQLPVLSKHIEVMVAIFSNQLCKEIIDCFQQPVALSHSKDVFVLHQDEEMAACFSVVVLAHGKEMIACFQQPVV